MIEYNFQIIRKKFLLIWFFNWIFLYIFIYDNKIMNYHLSIVYKNTIKIVTNIWLNIIFYAYLTIVKLFFLKLTFLKHAYICALKNTIYIYIICS